MCTETSLVSNPLLQTVLSNGEYLSYAGYARYLPFAPAILTSPITAWVGDTCRVANATIGIGSKVATLMNPAAGADEKVAVLIGIAQHILSISNTKYGQYVPALLPKNVCNGINLTYKTAKIGIESKNKLEAPSMSDRLEGLKLGALGANNALSLAGYSCFSPARLTLGTGYCALAAAKMVASTGEFFGKLARA